MQPPTIIAATAGSGRFPSPVTIALVVAAIGYVLWSRMQGQPLVPKRLIVLPAVLLVLGISGTLYGTRRARSHSRIRTRAALLGVTTGPPRACRTGVR